MFFLKFCNLQIIVRGWVGFFFFGIICWQWSISIFSSIPIFILNIFCTFISHFPQVSLGVSTILSIRMLFLLDLSSSSMSFLFILGYCSIFSSISLTGQPKFLMSVLIVFSYSSNWCSVCSRLLVSSVISVNNFSNRSFVDFIFEFISSLIAASRAGSSSLTIVLMVSRRIWLFSCGRVAVGVSGVGVDLSIASWFTFRWCFLCVHHGNTI